LFGKNEQDESLEITAEDKKEIEKSYESMKK